MDSLEKRSGAATQQSWQLHAAVCIQQHIMMTDSEPAGASLRSCCASLAESSATPSTVGESPLGHASGHIAPREGDKSDHGRACHLPLQTLVVS